MNEEDSHDFVLKMNWSLKRENQSFCLVCPRKRKITVTEIASEMKKGM
jgi:hypothetical protein